MTKICLISFQSGTRGTRLGYELATQYPSVFATMQRINLYHKPRLINGHYTYHMYQPFFHKEVFCSHPVLPTELLSSIEADKSLDPKKYNIVLTHHYTEEELVRLCSLFGSWTVTIIRVKFDESEVDYIANRFFAVHVTPNNLGSDLAEFKKQLTAMSETHAPNTIDFGFDKLKGEGPVDLSSLICYFTT